MIDTVNWTIVAAKGGFAVYDRRNQIGTIKVANGDTWIVNFPGARGLDFTWSGETALNVCVGYVRGVERCHVNQVHGSRVVFS